VDGRGIAFAVVVLAAGAGARFSSQPGAKLLANLDGRPILEHVLETVRSVRPVTTVVVLGHGATDIGSSVPWRDEIRVVNPTPERGLASSLQMGVRALSELTAPIDGTFIVLGDQPRLRGSVMQALVDAAAADRAQHPLVVPRYRDQPGPRNPVLLLRDAWGWVDELDGDRGLSSLVDTRHEQVLEVPVEGDMPDIDSPADLAHLRTRDPQP
jgi:molybdenum cofactor cytidylyltransferase